MRHGGNDLIWDGSLSWAAGSVGEDVRKYGGARPCHKREDFFLASEGPNGEAVRTRQVPRAVRWHGL